MNVFPRVPPMRTSPLALIVFLLSAWLASGVLAQVPGRVSDVRGTKHNFSTTPSPTGPTLAQLNRNVYSSTETQVCVFCHTPHGATQWDNTGGTQSTNAAPTPLWNRAIPATSTYTGYQSTSMDAASFTGQPGGSSKLCLSCHDGTIAVGQVNVKDGRGGGVTLSAGTGYLGTVGQISSSNLGTTTAYTFTSGTQSLSRLTGRTTNLGQDLTNDHPISVTYDSTLATADGELRPVNASQEWSNSDPKLIIGKRGPGKKPLLPLEPTGPGGAGQIQCATCHDPHIRSTDVANEDIKFLRLNRIQKNDSPKIAGAASDGTFTKDARGKTAITAGDFNETNDIICLACHQKEGWALSAHAYKNGTGNATYTAKGATDRSFPQGTQVWQAACLNCHDTHAVQGTRRLLREGVKSSLGWVDANSTIRQGSTVTGGTFADAAQENTCGQCHSKATSSATRVVDYQDYVGLAAAVSNRVPNVLSDFGMETATSAYRRMPISNSPEAHTIEKLTNYTYAGSGGITTSTTPPTATGTGPSDILAKDFVEQDTRLGQGNLTNRHVECTDCHNPHRVMRANRFNAVAPNNWSGYGAATHVHSTSAKHTNIISGALKGGWGVEPYSYPAETALLGVASLTGTSGFTTPLSGTEFGTRPSGFIIKYGNPPAAEPDEPAVSVTYLSREYQLCFKCHSNFAFADNGLPNELGDRPLLGCTNCTPQAREGTGSTARTGTNALDAYNFQRYTNQAMEFQSPLSHVGDGTRNNSGASKLFATNNHRSWHPVVRPTGRHSGHEGNWNPPFNTPANMGLQSMYCSDCHGNATGASTVVPDTGKPWGPHGSPNNYILKGEWLDPSGSPNALCLKCHTPSSSPMPHNIHNGDKTLSIRCHWCHTALPHGWKNRSFLINLNDIGPEVVCRSGIDPAITDPPCTAGQRIPPGTKITNIPGAGSRSYNTGYSNPPYYWRAIAKITSFPTHGTTWVQGNCTSESWMQSTCER